MEDQVILFEGPVPILVRRDEHEDKHMNLTIHVSTTSKVSSNTPYIRYTSIQERTPKVALMENNEQDIDMSFNNASKGSGGFKSTVLCVRITDEKDPFLLYSLYLSEEEFKTIKSTQSLLVDFNMFPGKIIDLLKSCSRSYSEENPTFFAMLSLRQNEGALRVLENTAFRQLDHLSLQLRAGNDTAVKQLLAAQLRQLKQTKEKLEQQLAYTDTSLRRKLSKTEQELEKLRCERDELFTAKEREVAAIKEQFYSEQQENISKFEQQKHSQEDVYRAQMRRMEERNEELEATNKELSHRKFQLESSNRDLTNRVHTLQSELASNKEELGSIREQNKSLDTTKHEFEKIINQQKIRISVLEQKNQDQEELLIQKNDMLKELEMQKGSTKETLSIFKERAQKSEEQLEETSKDLKKANHIIQRLSQEIKNQNTKLKHRKAMIKEQNRAMAQNSEISKEMRLESKDLKEKVEKRELQIEELKQSLKESNEKIEELIKQNEKQETVVSTLHRELTEYQRKLEQSDFRPAYSMPRSSFQYRTSTYSAHPAFSSYGAGPANEAFTSSRTGPQSFVGDNNITSSSERPFDAQPNGGPYFPISKSGLSSNPNSPTENETAVHYNNDVDRKNTGETHSSPQLSAPSTQPHFVY